jgi:thiol:disulfide interchange protein DsbA
MAVENGKAFPVFSDGSVCHGEMRPRQFRVDYEAAGGLCQADYEQLIMSCKTVLTSALPLFIIGKNFLGLHMNLYRRIVSYRLALTIVLAVAGIVTMAYYVSCDTACSYLRGDLLGIDLKYVGVGYMALIILLALLKQADLLRMLVAAGIGVEVFLVSFQIAEDVFCPFCLTFGVLVVLMYLVNYERAGMTTRWHHSVIYFFGDAKIPWIDRPRMPLLGMMILGWLFVSFAFSGSATPVYAAETPGFPSYGRGAWELIVCTDYFCNPCQDVENELAPELERLLASGSVRITFIDFPGHRGSGLYAKYFLAAVAADPGGANALKARKILFSLAAGGKVDDENVLAAALRSQKIPLSVIDPKPVFKQWSGLLKQYDIDQTPTCLLRFSSTYTKKYADAEAIRGKLIPELRKRFPR